jgi:hypothetical protein
LRSAWLPDALEAAFFAAAIELGTFCSAAAFVKLAKESSAFDADDQALSHQRTRQSFDRLAEIATRIRAEMKAVVLAPPRSAGNAT